MLKDGNPTEIKQKLETVENDLSTLLGAITEGMSNGVIKV